MRPSRIVQSSISLIFSNQRTVGSFLFWCFQFKLGIKESSVPVILWNSCNEPKEPPWVCYPSLITGLTLGCGDCQSSNPNTFHLGTSIEFGDLDHPGPGRPERRAPSVKIISGRSAFRPTGLRVKPSQSPIGQNVRDSQPERRAPSQNPVGQRRPKSPSSVTDLMNYNVETRSGSPNFEATFTQDPSRKDSV
jgi:hypothetical protein